MTHLTDRYITAVTRGVPSAQRDDIDRELRAAVADATDDRVEAGASPEAAEYAALSELGDPMVLAARYRGRPLSLIGPELYPTWKRLVTMLVVIVVPIILVVIPIVWLFRGEPVGEAIGAGLWIALEAGVHMVFWTTLAFAIAGRTSAGSTVLIPWTPDTLLESTTNASGPTTRNDLIWTVALAAAPLTLFIVSWFVSPFVSPEGDTITLLHPWMATSGLAIVLAAVPLLGILFAALHAAERGGRAVSICAFLVDVVGGIALIGLGLSGHVINPAFVEAAGWAPMVVPIVNYSAAGMGALLILASASVNRAGLIGR